jgi:hypothetical protein
MLFWRYSSTRIFVLNEYVILVPLMILADYLIIQKILSSRKKQKQKSLSVEENVNFQKNKARVVTSLAFVLSRLSKFRGGSDFVDVSYIQCGIEENLRFLDDERLRKLIHYLFKYKRRNKIIFITATALCQVAKMHANDFIGLPFIIGDFGITDLFQAARKFIVILLFTGITPILIAGGPVSLAFAFIMVTMGLRLSFTNTDKILTSFIDEKILAKSIKPRIPGTFDVVVVNLKNKITMTNPALKNKECWLPEQRIFNRVCQVKPTQIPNAIEMVAHNLKYDDVVNLQDVTHLDKIDFSDILELGQTEPIISKPRIGKTVTFREFIAEMVNGDNNPDSDFIDTAIGIVKESIPIQIENKD